MDDVQRFAAQAGYSPSTFKAKGRDEKPAPAPKKFADPQMQELYDVVETWRPKGEAFDREPFDRQMFRALLNANAAAADLRRALRGERPIRPLADYPVTPDEQAEMLEASQRKPGPMLRAPHFMYLGKDGREITITVEIDKNAVQAALDADPSTKPGATDGPQGTILVNARGVLAGAWLR